MHGNMNVKFKDVQVDQCNDFFKPQLSMIHVKLFCLILIESTPL